MLFTLTFFYNVAEGTEWCNCETHQVSPLIHKQYRSNRKISDKIVICIGCSYEQNSATPILTILLDKIKVTFHEEFFCFQLELSLYDFWLINLTATS